MTEGGFGRVEAIVEGLDSYRGHKVKVLAKNENYLVRCVEGTEAGAGSGNDGAVLACTPDLICVVDSETGMYGDRTIIMQDHIIVFFTTSFLSCLAGYPITTESVRYGLRVGVLALPANPRLLTPRAMQVVGPAAFGCPSDVQYHAPRSLQQVGGAPLQLRHR